MKARRILLFVFMLLSIAINVFIIVEGATNGGDSSNQSLGITNWLIDIAKEVDPNGGFASDSNFAHIVTRKLFGHFGLFALDGILSTLMFVFMDEFMERKKEIIISILMYGFFFAFVSELVQYFTPGRYMSMVDVLIDYSGYVIAGAVTYFISFVVIHNKKTNP